MKYFSFNEAEGLIPRLEEIFSVIGDVRSRVDAQKKKFQPAEKGGSSNPALKPMESSESQVLLQNLERVLGEIEGMGVVLKGLDPVLVDFPFRLHGKEVYLCWKHGEKAIRYYHGLEDGFSGRKPLPKELFN